MVEQENVTLIVKRKDFRRETCVGKINVMHKLFG